ncbi:MAG TPA: hypothetical protein VEJ20_07405 [Candidatus Eremiobacteraceae bacterium]|nr:hypothetical protein [Candidatus Eremiobacteraceae bacterium]
MPDKPDKQQEMLKKFTGLGFVIMGKAANGNVFVELRGNDPVRAVVSPDGAVQALSGDVSRFDWISRKGKP